MRIPAALFLLSAVWASEVAEKSGPLIWPCPPCICFHCAKPEFACTNNSACNQASGLCEGCPVGFGGDDCKKPLCGSLFKKDRAAPEKDGQPCACDDGWDGINCNVCLRDEACPQGTVCYRGNMAVGRAYKSCDADLPEFYKRLLGGKKTSVTAECTVTDRRHRAAECDVQFWLDQQEQFYCRLMDCLPRSGPEIDKYVCGRVVCKCIQKSTLCAANRLIDLTPVLDLTKGPAEFSCNKSGACVFSERTLNDYFQGGIRLDCKQGECVHPDAVPGVVGSAVSLWKWLLLLLSTIALGVGAHYAVVFVASIVALQRQISEKPEPLPLLSQSKDKENAESMSFSFSQICYRLGSLRVLKGASGALAPGQLMAIVGGSGAGKTSCLDILAMKHKKGVVKGDIRVNGVHVTEEEMQSICGFVDQEDTLMGTLTVRETLMYSALLRLPAAMSLGDKRVRVEEVMEELSIGHLADRKIGVPGQRGISGGEKRRVSIAQELVTNPKILFLDEPTSGLDSYSAFVVVETLSKLAKNHNRTIVCTIHQPRSNIFALFDKLLLLAEGRMLYSGPAAEAATYFSELGFFCPAGYNTADFLVDLGMSEGTEYRGVAGLEDLQAEGDAAREDESASLLSHGLNASSTILDRVGSWIGVELARNEESKPKHSAHVRKLARDFAESPRGIVLADELRLGSVSLHSRRPTADTPQKAASSEQLLILSARSLLNLYRNPLLLMAHYAITVTLSVFIGLLFWRVSNDMAGVQNRLGCLFFVLAFFGFGSLTALEIFSTERVLFQRERANGFYNPSIYFASKIIFDLIPLRTVPSLIFGSIIYAMVGFYPTWTAFLKFQLVVVLFNVVSASAALLAAICIAQPAIANLLASLGTLFAMLFGGFLLNKHRIPFPLSCLQYLSWFNYAFEALIVNELSKIVLHDTETIEFDVPGTLILRQFGFDSEAYGGDIAALLLMAAVFLLLAYAGMHLLVREKR